MRLIIMNSTTQLVFTAVIMAYQLSLGFQFGIGEEYVKVLIFFYEIDEIEGVFMTLNWHVVHPHFCNFHYP